MNEIVKATELGLCWAAERYCGGRCQRSMSCKLEEKKDCKAVMTEVKHIIEQYRKRTTVLTKALEKILL